MDHRSEHEGRMLAEAGLSVEDEDDEEDMVTLFSADKVCYGDEFWAEVDQISPEKRSSNPNEAWF